MHVYPQFMRNKSQIPLGPSTWGKHNVQAKRAVGLEKSVIMLNRLCFVKQLSEHNFFYFCISLSGI